MIKDKKQVMDEFISSLLEEVNEAKEKGKKSLTIGASKLPVACDQCLDFTPLFFLRLSAFDDLLEKVKEVLVGCNARFVKSLANTPALVITL